MDTQLTPAQEITAKLYSQVAIKATEFGAIMGMDKQQTSRAITDGRLGVPTFQAVERGRHMVSCHAALEYFAAHGVTLPTVPVTE